MDRAASTDRGSTSRQRTDHRVSGFGALASQAGSVSPSRGGESPSREEEPIVIGTFSAALSEKWLTVKNPEILSPYERCQLNNMALLADAIHKLEQAFIRHATREFNTYSILRAV